MSRLEIIMYVIFITIAVIIFIPWYTKQLGRFFCSGLIEFLNDILKIGNKNKKENKDG